MRLRNQKPQLFGNSVSCTKKDPRCPLLAEQNIASFLERGGASSDPTRSWLRSWCLFLGDGATVNGSQAQLQATLRPTAWSQLGLCFCRKFKRSFTEESLFTCWCSSHRIDLCAKKLEDQQNVQSILRMVRRAILSHCFKHGRARPHEGIDQSDHRRFREGQQKHQLRTSKICFTCRWWVAGQQVVSALETHKSTRPGPTRRSSSNVPTLLLGRPAF